MTGLGSVIQDQAVWLPVNEVAALTGLAPRTVQMRCRKGIYATRTAESSKGVQRYEVALSSLDVKYQKKYAPIRLKAASRVSLKELKEWQREAAFKRLEMLLEWEKFAEEKQMGISLVIEEFREKMRKEKGVRISKPTLYRWKKAVKNNMADLAPKWNNGRPKFAEDKFDPEAKRFAHDVWLHGSRPTMKEGWFQTRKKAEMNGWRIPSYGTFKRFFGDIPRPVKMKLRHGKKKFEDYAVPVIFRDYEDPNLKPMGIVVGDHHQVDVACIFPDTGIRFPWITTWMDIRSRKVVGYTLCSQPSSDSINISFQGMGLEYGIPEHVYLDNGKDYKCKLFLGEKGIKEESINVTWDKYKFEGIYKELGVKTIFAIPRNAKAKPIERMFLTFINGFSVHWRGFRGRDTKQRPEDLLKNWKEGNLPTFEELKRGLAGYINFYNEERPHRGHGMHERTPNEVFFEGLKTKRAVKPEELALLCSRKGTATVTQNGLYLFDEDWYRAPEIMFHYQGRKVRYLYNEDDITKVFVFTLEGQFIGIAEKYNRAQFGQDSEKYAQQMRWKKTVREATKSWEEEHIPVRMSGKEREHLILSRSPKKKEPALAAEVYETKYAQLVEEFNLLEKKRKETHELLKKHSMKLAGFKGNAEKDNARAEQAKVYHLRKAASIAGDANSEKERAEKVKVYQARKAASIAGDAQKKKELADRVEGYHTRKPADSAPETKKETEHADRVKDYQDRLAANIAKEAQKEKERKEKIEDYFIKKSKLNPKK